MRRLLFVVAISLAFFSQSSATEFRSEERQGAMLELYTSQGCSSCPPADAWLSELVEHPQLWQRLFPVAFHVDYWNYLGWRDPYSKPANSDRQRWHKRVGNARSVYTPGFVLVGKEWKAWFIDRQNTDVPLATNMAGVLLVQINEGRVTARFSSTDGKAETTPMLLSLAVLGFGIETQVPAGENRGRKLLHNFVVLGQVSSQSESGQWQMALPSLAENKAKQLALVAWVEKPSSPSPLQVTGGWLTKQDVAGVGLR